MLNSISKSGRKGEILDGDLIINYVTNLMESILSLSSNDKSYESLLTTINLILSSSSKMIETLSSVHVSLAVKSTLQSSTETLVQMIKRNDKLAKAFRKLFLKESHAMKESLAKLLLSTLASIENKNDVKLKFVKEIKNIFEEILITKK